MCGGAAARLRYFQDVKEDRRLPAAAGEANKRRGLHVFFHHESILDQGLYLPAHAQAPRS